MQKLGTNLYLLAAAMCLFARIFYEWEKPETFSLGKFPT